MSRLVVVSNRVALPEEFKPGGLASGMLAALREIGGIWFGWSGKLAEDGGSTVRVTNSKNITFATIDLSRRDHGDYYAGFANRTLWPLFHFRPSLVDFDRSAYDGYLRVNTLFADRLAELLEPDDVVWIHDYHLIPLAQHLRARGVRSRLGFFLHTPFPPIEILSMLPVHRELFESLTSYDLVGFQTDGYMRAFRDYLIEEAHAEVNEHGLISLQGGRRNFRAGCFPIGIDVGAVARLAEEAVGQPAYEQLRTSIDNRTLVIGVDRLDYSKGLPERFITFGRMLETRPEWLRRVTLLQIAPSSRGEVAEYRKLRRELERIAGSINGRYATPDWVPVRYVNRGYDHRTLMGFYRLAKVGLVTPLRDGMNLVAKEYLASQDPDDPGVLVLSRFAGAARELRAALLVNPYDVEGTAETLRAALSMSQADRIARWRDCMDVLRANDITAWRQRFLALLMAGSPTHDFTAPPANDGGKPDGSGAPVVPTHAASRSRRAAG
ncbi:MAG TPA: alpha,alpha-trehalose-phosphate synthase (UDP-forming) [Xanthomonadales bacterium]|nr:alpha,alpha-trehalose-phosphate synthase (UDP-forming) [Xanthomonadales bacterium]